MNQKIVVVLNGATITLTGGTSLAAMLAARGTDTRGAAVEIDGTIVPRGHWDERILHDGERIELVHMVGGGA